MARYTKEDKKLIAAAQKQVVYETDDLTGESTNRVRGYRCKLCKRVFDLDIMEVDHIYPQARRGGERPSNLQLLCPPCNKKKGSKVQKTVRKTVAKPLTKKATKRTKGKG